MFQIWSPGRLRWMSAERAASFQLWDLRSPEAFSQGHLPGAFSLPLSEETGALTETQLAQIMDSGCLPVFYCEHGGKSMRAARQLGRSGIPAASLGFGFSTFFIDR